MNLADYVAIVAVRCQLDDPDPEKAHVAGCVQQAVASYQAANRRGWDFLHRDVTLTTVADQQAYTFQSLAETLEENLDDLDVPLDPLPYPIRRVYTVSLVTESGAHTPLDRLSRYELDERYGTVGGMPSSWTAENRTLRLYPPPNAESTLLLRVLIRDFIDAADDDSEPLLPDEYQGLIIELASSYVYRDIRDRQRAADALAAYQVELRNALGDMPVGGPGRPVLDGR